MVLKNGFISDEEIDRITVMKFRFALQDCISRSQLEDMVAHNEYSWTTDSMIRQIKFGLLGNEHKEEQINSKTEPATIWEELKRDFAPKWFLKNHPVRYVTTKESILIKHYHICPHIHQPSSDSSHYEFLRRVKR